MKLYKTQSNQLRKLSKIQYDTLKELCHDSKSLYNVALYNDIQTFSNTRKYTPYFNNHTGNNENFINCMENTNYKLLNAMVSQQVLMSVDRNFKSFFALLKAKKKGTYQAKVSIPKYLPKDGYFSLVMPKGAFHIKGNKIRIGLSRLFKKELVEKTGLKDIELDYPTQIDETKVQEIRIVPKANARFFKMEVVYKIGQIDLDLDQTRVLSIDIGVSNFATCSDISNNMAFIMDGKKIKSINRYWNKQIRRLQSIKDKQKIKGYTKQQFTITRKRNNRIKDSMNKDAHYIIQYCIDNNIGTIVVGRNKGWKQKVNLGKRNNQNFVQVPFTQLLSKLNYKCQEYGIKYIEVNEAYTSKCSALDNEEVKKHDNYLGKRISRGLFRSKDGFLINADVNAAINIARRAKVSGKQFSTVNSVEGILAYPKRIRVA